MAHSDQNRIECPKIQQYKYRMKIIQQTNQNSPWLLESEVNAYLKWIYNLDIKGWSNYKYIRLIIKITNDILKGYGYGHYFRRMRIRDINFIKYRLQFD